MWRRLRQLTQRVAPSARAARCDSWSTQPPTTWRSEWQPNSVAAEQHDVGRQHERADADAERHRAGRRIGEPERLPHVVGEDQQDRQRQEQEVAMDVLQDERKRVLAPVARARLADGARRRIGPERLVVRAAVVVAGEPEERRESAGSAAPARTAATRATPPASVRTSCAARRRRAPASRTARDTGPYV